MSLKPLPENKGGISELYADRRLEDIAARWDAKARDWDQSLIDPLCHLNEDRSYIRFLEQLDSVLRTKQNFCAAKGVLDAGCATGHVLTRAMSWFAWGVGVDISPRMIELAQTKQLARARFLVGDCFKLSSICPKAGAVLSRGVLLSHYGQTQAIELLRNARACLEPGGFILWDFLNAAARHSFRHIPEKKAYYDSDEICAMAANADFSNVQVLGEPQRRVKLLLAGT